MNKPHALVFSICAILCTESVSAENQPTPDTAIEEIVVTAQKRAESELTVPISIAALSGNALASQHIEDFMDLTRAVPGLSFNTNGGPGMSSLEIRGVSSSAGGSTVAVYMDETPVATPHIQAAQTGTTEPLLLDIDRVEVLRGPQGTLYGASSMGGTVRFLSRQPDVSSAEAVVDSDLSQTRQGGFNYRVTAAVNLPLVNDAAAVRVAALYGHDDGWVNQLAQTGETLARRVNDQETAALRVTGLIAPVPDLNIVPAVYVQRVTAGDTSVFFDTLGAYDEANYVREPLRDMLVLPSLKIDWHNDGIALTSVSSFLTRDFSHAQDGTVINSQYLAGVAAAPPPDGFGFGEDALGGLASPIFARTTVSQWSQELRVASREKDEASQRLSWVAGVYVSDQRVTYNEDDYIPGFGSSFVTLYGISAESFFGVPFPGDSVYTVRNHYDERQYAAFGDLTFTLAPGLRLSAGLRYLRAREASDLSTGDFFGTGEQSQVSFEHSSTPKVSLTYLASPDATVYATAAKGYRLGGGNSAIPQSLCGGDLANLGLTAAPLSYKSDSLWSYETGTKLRFLDSSISVDADVYYIKWNDIQQEIYLPTCAYIFEANVGNAKSYGSELAITANATRYLTLSASGGTTEATITQNVAALNVASGAHVLGVPEWSGHLGARLHADAWGLRDVFFQSDYALTGPSSGSFDPTQADYRRPRYQVLNLSTGASMAGLQVSVYVQNALNDRKAIQHINNNGIIESLALKPFTVGVTLRKSVAF